jgi:hypothetical protein
MQRFNRAVSVALLLTPLAAFCRPAAGDDALPALVAPYEPAPSPATSGDAALALPPAWSGGNAWPATRAWESSIYDRLEYYHWNERVGGMDFVNEDGVLFTLGYARRVGRERYRVELFGTQANYSGAVQYSDGSTEPLDSVTNYLGLRGEYELLFEPPSWPRLTWFIGLGTRFWFRDLPDDFTASGTLVTGYQETWWTIYPYLGIENRRTVTDAIELYASGRIGLTAITYENVTIDDVRLYPQPGLTARVEGGLRGQSWFLAATFEVMTWGESPVVSGWLQPASQMYTVGLKTGFSF